MISIIIMIMLFISFFVVVSYNMMSVNHNLAVSSQMDTIDNELNTIKNKLIQSAKPIVSSDNYSLPYGQDIAASKEHRLPSDMGISIKNANGHYYQYCPYGIYDADVSKTHQVSQNDGTNYGVNVQAIGSIEYVTESEFAPSYSTSPEVAAFVISKFENSVVSCSDVMYDVNSAVYYLTNAKVETITKNDINNYYSTKDLSGVTEMLSLDSSNADAVFSILENDVSNKSYKIDLAENISMSSNYSIKKRKSNRSDIAINLNGYTIRGSKDLEFKNVDLDVYSGSKATDSSALANFIVEDSDISLENAQVGALTANNSNVIMEDSEVFATNATSFEIINSDVVVRGNSKIVANLTTVTNAAMHLNGSHLFVEDAATLTLEHQNKNPNYMIGLYSSKLEIYGTINETTSTSKKVGDNPVYIDKNSELYLNSGKLELLGKGVAKSSNYPFIYLSGTLSSGGSNSRINAISTAYLYDFILIDGGQLLLDNIRFADNGNVGSGYAIREASLSGHNEKENIRMMTGENDVYINYNGRCWTGPSFYLMDGSTIAESGSDKTNNLTDYTCN